MNKRIKESKVREDKNKEKKKNIKWITTGEKKKQSHPTQSEGEKMKVEEHALFTPFLPLRSFLYCSFSWAIRL